MKSYKDKQPRTVFVAIHEGMAGHSEVRKCYGNADDAFYDISQELKKTEGIVWIQDTPPEGDVLFWKSDKFAFIRVRKYEVYKR